MKISALKKTTDKLALFTLFALTLGGILSYFGLQEMEDWGVRGKMTSWEAAKHSIPVGFLAIKATDRRMLDVTKEKYRDTFGYEDQ